MPTSGRGLPEGRHELPEIEHGQPVAPSGRHVPESGIADTPALRPESHARIVGIFALFQEYTKTQISNRLQTASSHTEAATELSYGP